MSKLPINPDAPKSSGKLGWTKRVIIEKTRYQVTLDDGVSFSSDCFKTAEVGDTWLVNHIPGQAVFGAIKDAVKLRSAVS